MMHYDPSNPHQHYTRDVSMSEVNMIVDYVNRMEFDYAEMQRKLVEAKSELAAERIKRESAERRLEALQAAVADVVQRWDSPMWRHETHTGVYIDALRTAKPPPPKP